MYDAVMSVGLGACAAQAALPGAAVTGEAHATGIRSLKFSGASGQVKFGDIHGDLQRNGTRMSSTITWGAYNILPPTAATSPK